MRHYAIAAAAVARAEVEALDVVIVAVAAVVVVAAVAAASAAVPHHPPTTKHLHQNQNIKVKFGF